MKKISKDVYIDTIFKISQSVSNCPLVLYDIALCSLQFSLLLFMLPHMILVNTCIHEYGNLNSILQVSTIKPKHDDFLMKKILSKVTRDQFNKSMKIYIIIIVIRFKGSFHVRMISWDHQIKQDTKHPD